MHNVKPTPRRPNVLAFFAASKWPFVFSILSLVLFLPTASAQYSLFDTSYVHEIRISSDNPDFWQQLDDDYANWLSNGVEIPYREADVIVDGDLLVDVGVRQKGYSSNFFSTTTKKPLKLNFGIFVEDRELDGVRKLNLMNGLGDAAIVKDRIVYNMFRMHGVPGPRVAHARIFINETFWGVYALIEQIDKRYLKRNFSDNDGNLWKNKGYSELHWAGEVPSNYPFELQTNEDEDDWSEFFAFVDFINNASDSDFAVLLEEIFELDEYLRIIAIDILSNNWDSYLDHGRNWYMYHEPRIDKMHWIPWDYNFAFDRTSSGVEDLDLVQTNPDKVLVYRVFQVPGFRLRIFDYMCEILEVNFTHQRIDPILDHQLALLIAEWGASNDFFDIDDLDDSINGETWDGSYNGPGTQGFKRYLTDRAATIEDGLSLAGHTCDSLTPAINPQDVVINEFMARNDDGSPWFDQDGESDDWIELYNNTASPISLNNYFLSDDASFVHKWELPDNAIIGTNDYLIVWADKDIDQIGLHAKFSLDKDGGDIFFSNLDGTLIDFATYTAQEKNESMSRMPNGTGDFVNAEVTFGTENLMPNLVSADGFEDI